jgi:hypothetical protein
MSQGLHTMAQSCVQAWCTPASRAAKGSLKRASPLSVSSALAAAMMRDENATSSADSDAFLGHLPGRSSHQHTLRAIAAVTQQVSSTSASTSSTSPCSCTNKHTYSSDIITSSKIYQYLEMCTAKSMRAYTCDTTPCIKSMEYN